MFRSGILQRLTKPKSSGIVAAAAVARVISPWTLSTSTAGQRSTSSTHVKKWRICKQFSRFWVILVLMKWIWLQAANEAEQRAWFHMVRERERTDERGGIDSRPRVKGLQSKRLYWPRVSCDNTAHSSAMIRRTRTPTIIECDGQNAGCLGIMI
jgi:hypothetical protein